MKNFYVKATADLPYPILKEFTIKAGSLGTAACRACKQYREHIRNIRGRRKITSIRLTIWQL